MFTIIPIADRNLINAVANMGYDHEVALCDLVDNSIDAQAKTINIHSSKAKSTGGRKEIISHYLIADDGIGLDKNTLINAFNLTSPQFLEKYGFRLSSE